MGFLLKVSAMYLMLYSNAKNCTSIATLKPDFYTITIHVGQEGSFY